MNRREILLRGALLASLAPGVQAITAPVKIALAVVQDPAYRRSREFAALMAQRGARRFTPKPDVLALWHGSLHAYCLQQGTALRIAGLTTWSDYLVLRDCARTAGLVPITTLDVDAGGARRRATLLSWVLGARSASASA